MISSVPTSLHSSANFAAYSLSRATDDISTATARLSSGSRFVRASDDVAGLAVATSLNTNIITLRSALQNSSLAGSMMQMAYDGLSSISDTLTSMLSLATRATSSSLSSIDRAALQVDLDELTAEIDNVAAGTAFNSIKLLDGSIAGDNLVTTASTGATAGQATLTFGANPAAAQTVVINGVTLTANTDFTVGGSTNITLLSLANAINTSTNSRLSNLYASVAANQLTVSSRAGGTLSNRFLINQGGSTAAFSTGGATTATAGLYQFVGGLNNGIGEGKTTVTGTIGDTVVNTQSQSRGYVQLVASTNFADGDTFSIDDGAGGTTVYTFRTAPSTSSEALIGADARETLQNLVSTIKQTTGNSLYVLNQLDFVQSGNTLTVQSKEAGNAQDLSFANLDFAVSSAAAMLSSTVLNNGVTTGVYANGITNKDFTGTVGGFTANYLGADNVGLTLTVGGYTYSASIADTTPATNTTIRMQSLLGGGYFDIQLRGGAGTTVSNQTDANTYAARMTQAFSSLSFAQTRTATSFTGTGDLVGASFDFTSDDFSKVVMNNVKVSAPAAPGLSAKIEFTVNGETFTSATNLGTRIGAYQQVEFQSTESSNSITLRNGSQNIDLSNATATGNFQNLLKTSFGLGTGSGNISFQLGDNPGHLLEVSISSASTDRIFQGASLSLASISSSISAESVIQNALDTITGMMASVGAYQERTVIASDHISAQLISKTEAHDTVARPDMALESTRLASSMVQAQSAIAVLAQTNALQNYMLHLLESAA